jgi:capsular polysaccharide biosynthesis protein
VNEQPLDLKRFLRGLRRCRVLVVALVIIGASAGVAYDKARPVMPQAAALVILSPSSAYGTSGGLDMSTQVIIASSEPVLSSVGASLRPPMSAGQLSGLVKVHALSEDIMQLDAAGATTAQAKLIADDVSSAYIRYVTTDDVGTTQQALAELQGESTKLTGQIQSIQDQINVVSARLVTEGADSAAGQRDSAYLQSLRENQDQLSVQLDDVNNEIVSTQFSGSLAAVSSAVLQRAVPVAQSGTRPLELGGVGAVAGLTAGCLLVLALLRRDRRLRTRDEIAVALGAPVLASMDSERCRRPRDWSKLLRSYQPSPVEAWSARKVFYHVAQSDALGHARMVVLALPDDGASLVAGTQLARSGAAAGFPVVLEPGPQPALAALRAVCSTEPSRTEEGGVTFVAAPGSHQASVQQMTVSLQVALPDGLEQVAPGPAILVVSSGFATEELLARVALLAADRGLLIEGVLVVNPDPADGSTGMVPRAVETHLVLHRPATTHVPGGQLITGRTK